MIYKENEVFITQPTPDLVCTSCYSTITGNLAINLYNINFKEQCVSLLIPDRSKQNQEDFIWALPIERVKWNNWYELSKSLRTATPQGVRYMKRKEGEKIITVLVMPNKHQTDDDAMTACAYLRMVEGFSCRMWIVRCTDDSQLTGAKLINAVMGIDRDTLQEIDEDEINEEIAKMKEKNNAKPAAP